MYLVFTRMPASVTVDGGGNDGLSRCVIVPTVIIHRIQLSLVDMTGCPDVSLYLPSSQTQFSGL